MIAPVGGQVSCMMCEVQSATSYACGLGIFTAISFCISRLLNCIHNAETIFLHKRQKFLHHHLPRLFCVTVLSMLLLQYVVETKFVGEANVPGGPTEVVGRDSAVVDERVEQAPAGGECPLASPVNANITAVHQQFAQCV